MDNTNAVQQVVEEALSHTNNSDYGYEGFSHLLENEQFASWVGSQLMSFLATGNGQQLMADLQNVLGYVDAAMTRYAELIERNAELASALGACTCWGELEDCEACHGEGTSGWIMPDQEMFSLLVVPALLTVNRSKAPRIVHTR